MLSAPFGLWPLQQVGFYPHITWTQPNRVYSTGPPIGGALAGSNWHWLFYMNLPLTAIVFAIVALCMDLKVPAGTMREKLGRMDW